MSLWSTLKGWSGRLLSDRLASTESRLGANPAMPEILARLDVEYAAERNVQLYPGLDREDPHPSKILQFHSPGAYRLGELYDDMETDGRLYAEMLRRASTAVALRQYLEPGRGSKGSKAEQAAELCRSVLPTADDKAATCLSEVQQVQIQQLIERTGRGISFTEIMWHQVEHGPLAGYWLPCGLKNRPMSRFAFLQGRLHLRRPGVGLHGLQPAPDFKFLMLRHGSTDSPWGVGLYGKLHRPWFLRKEVLKYWARDIEAFASPPVGVEVSGEESRRSATPGKATLSLTQKALAVGRALVSSKVFTFPKSFRPELFERKRGGDSAGFASFLGEMAKVFALLISGQIALSGLRGSVGSYAADETHAKVEKTRSVLDAKDLAALYQTLCNWITWLNFGYRVEPPTFRVHVEDLDDRRVQFEALQLAEQFGLATSEKTARRVLSNPKPRDGEPLAWGGDATADSNTAESPQDPENQPQDSGVIAP